MSVKENAQGYPGQQTPSTDSEDFNLQVYLTKMMMSRQSTATLVKVTKVDSTNGTVAAVGRVSVQPLVKMADGNGKVFEHGIINDVPYFRMQGSADRAVIIDPKVGDIGLAVFADRDISSVKKNKKTSPPGSWRRFDMADGLFFGNFLGSKPKCYIHFTDDNKIVMTPDDKATATTTIEVNKITHLVGSTPVIIRPNRIDLGEDMAPNAVETTAGPSTVVFAKV